MLFTNTNLEFGSNHLTNLPAEANSTNNLLAEADRATNLLAEASRLRNPQAITFGGVYRPGTPQEAITP